MDPEQIPIRDLHLPELIGWWPLAPGWWVLIALAMVGLALLARHYFKSRARGKARRHALQQLEHLLCEYEQNGDAVGFAAAVSALLRRTMLAYAPRAEIAGMTGDEWLAWLDRDLAHRQFVNGPGRMLLDLPYRPRDTDIPGAEIYALVTAVRQRVATPVGGQG